MTFKAREGWEIGARLRAPGEDVICGCESTVYVGAPTPKGNRYVTKVIHVPDSDASRASAGGMAGTVAKLLLMQGMSDRENPNPDIARMHYVAVVREKEGHAIFLVQDYVRGKEVAFGAFGRLSVRTRGLLDDICGHNVLMSKQGPKVIDGNVNEQLFDKRALRDECRDACGCDWNAFAERSARGFGSVPEDYSLPRRLVNDEVCAANANLVPEMEASLRRALRKPAAEGTAVYRMLGYVAGIL